MTKKSNRQPSQNKKVKQGGALILVIALLILGVNWLLNQRGEALPTEITEAAETAVADSFTDTEIEEEQMGETAVSTSSSQPNSPTNTTTVNTPWADANGDFDYYVLALSWQPAFCETKSRKPECASQTNGRFDATNFVLHGLWPNQNNDPSHNFGYCEQPQTIINTDQDGDWCELPELPLSAAVANELTTFMPGAASCLDHHEWYKHGTCAGMSADAYFALTNELVAQFAQTEFNQYVAAHIGSEVSRNDLLHEFEAEFGPGSDDYLSLRCNKVAGTSLLSELQLVLKKELAEVDDFSQLFPDEKVSPQGNCPQQFVIDPVG